MRTGQAAVSIRRLPACLQLRDRGYQFVLDADVTAYFDNVDHALLLCLLPQEANSAGHDSGNRMSKKTT